MPQVWKWNPKKREVLMDVFLGDESQAKIAQKHHMTRDALRAWLRNEAFQAELQKLRDTLELSLFTEDVRYVTKEHRISALARMAESARAEYEAHPLLREIRPLPTKAPLRIKVKMPEGEVVTDETEPIDAIVNESFNRDAHAAFRDSLNDIAKELGHRMQKVEHSGNADAPLVVWNVPQKPR